MYDRILVATDGSEESLRALDHALDIAGQYGATLHALYVVDGGHPLSDLDGGAMDLGPLFEALHEEGERTLERIEERAEEAGTPCVTAVREAGSVHGAILDYADENDVDLLVLASHGRRGLDRLLLGSVTERILRTSDIPVLVVRGTP